jgi:hypothetical protein
MMKLNFTEKVNPVGRPYNVLDNEVLALESQWDAESGPSKKCIWYDPRTWINWFKEKKSLVAVVSFILNSLDHFIKFIEKFKEMSGADKKATVLIAVDKLYDYIAKEALPIWLKPFSAKIKHFIVYVAVSYLVDFMVGKYNEGLWRDKNGTEVEEGAK